MKKKDYSSLSYKNYLKKSIPCWGWTTSRHFYKVLKTLEKNTPNLTRYYKHFKESRRAFQPDDSCQPVTGQRLIPNKSEVTHTH
jgi:hypothetical protein